MCCQNIVNTAYPGLHMLVFSRIYSYCIPGTAYACLQQNISILHTWDCICLSSAEYIYTAYPGLHMLVFSRIYLYCIPGIAYACLQQNISILHTRDCICLSSAEYIYTAYPGLHMLVFSRIYLYCIPGTAYACLQQNIVNTAYPGLHMLVFSRIYLYCIPGTAYACLQPIHRKLLHYITGWYCTLNASSDMETVYGGECQPGYYCPEGSWRPLDCSPGTYCETAGLDEPTDNCTAGMWKKSLKWCLRGFLFWFLY